VLAVLFVAWERRAERPMLDLSRFGDARFTVAISYPATAT